VGSSESIGCPYSDAHPPYPRSPFSSQLYQLIIDFLISRAIADEYADRAKLYASGAAKAAAIATANVAKQLGLDESNLASAVDTSKVLDEESDEARKLIIDALNPLCEILRLPKIDMKTSEAEIRAISRESTSQGNVLLALVWSTHVGCVVNFANRLHVKHLTSSVYPFSQPI